MYVYKYKLVEPLHEKESHSAENACAVEWLHICYMYIINCAAVYTADIHVACL